MVGTWAVAPRIEALPACRFHRPIAEVHNTKAIGNVLYTDYIYLFQAAGLVLLVAMIGAIVLTLRQREGVRRQSIAGNRSAASAGGRLVELKDMPSGRGLSMLEIGLSLPVGRRDPVHPRDLRHLPEPQERHHHPDVDRADAARGQYQPGRVLGPSGAISSARSSPCSC